jgi:transposase-like protein
VDQAQQSQRQRKLAAVCWRLGLSYRGIEVIFTAIGFGIDHMTAWRDVQAQAETLRQQRKQQPVRVLVLMAPMCAAGERPSRCWWQSI